VSAAGASQAHVDDVNITLDQPFVLR